MEEDDLYDGYNDFSSTYNTDVSYFIILKLQKSNYISILFLKKNLNYDQQFQQVVAKTSHGRRPPPVISIVTLYFKILS